MHPWDRQVERRSWNPDVGRVLIGVVLALVLLGVSVLAGIWTVGSCHLGDGPPEELRNSAYRDLCLFFDGAPGAAWIYGGPLVVLVAAVAQSRLLLVFVAAAAVLCLDLAIFSGFVLAGH